MTPEPLIIQGPGIITFNTVTMYFEDDITVALKRESFNPKGAFSGPLGERHKSSIFEITGNLFGQQPTLANFAKIFPYTPADIGKSIMNGALVITSIVQAQSWTYHRAGVNKLPDVNLHPLKTLFGQIGFLAIGKAATAPTDAAFIKTVAAGSFSDAYYDPDKVYTDQYEAAWGASPFDSMGSHDGFLVKQSMGTKNLESADRGITDVILDSLGAEVSFPPSNLTHEEVDTLLGIQDTDVVMPGESYAKAAEDLVITGPNLICTCLQMGPKDGGYKHQLGENEVQGVTFVNNLKYTLGVGQRLVQFTEPA